MPEYIYPLSERICQNRNWAFRYFSLPVFAGNTFIARIDAKAYRKQKVLIIHNMHFEPIISTRFL